MDKEKKINAEREEAFSLPSVSELCDAAERFGVLEIWSALGPRQLRIPFRSYMADVSVDELNLSVRSRNCLMRTEILSFAQLNEKLMGDDDIGKIRNLGAKSRAEILRTFFADCYSRLNSEGKADYWRRVLEEDLD